MTSISRIHIALLSIILAFSGLFRIGVMNLPFGRNPEGCAAFFGLVARNYFRYPFSAHHGVPVTSMGQGAPVMYYANHPPTTPLLIGGVFALAGYRGEFDPLPPDWQVRLPTAIFTLGCIALIFYLVAKRAGPRAGLLSAALFAAIPMTLIYGGFPDVISPQLIFFALLTMASYERFHDSPNAKTFAVLCASFAGAGIMDWPAFMMVPVLCLHFVLTSRPKQWGWIIAFGFFSVAVFGLLYVYLATAQGNWKWMTSLVQRRSISTSGDADHAFGFMEWLKDAVWQFAIGRHTLIVFVLAAIGVGIGLIRRSAGGADRFMGLLIAWAMVHIFVGAQGVYKHEWWWWPLTPGLVIAAAIGWDACLSWIERSVRMSRQAINISAIVAMVLFAAWNTRAALIEDLTPTNIGKDDLAYSLPEIGDAIRRYTPAGASAILAEKDDSLGFWYYADRAIKVVVWDMEKLNTRMNDSTADLSFYVAQHYEPRPSTLILPRFHATTAVPQFAAALDARYPKIETPKFFIYDLAHPLAPPPATDLTR